MSWLVDASALDWVAESLIFVLVLVLNLEEWWRVKIS